MAVAVVGEEPAADVAARLEHCHVESCLPQTECRRQPGHPGADDNNFSVCHGVLRMRGVTEVDAPVLRTHVAEYRLEDLGLSPRSVRVVADLCHSGGEVADHIAGLNQE